MIDYTTFPLSKLVPELKERDIQIKQLENENNTLRHALLYIRREIRNNNADYESHEFYDIIYNALNDIQEEIK